jgi:Ca2+-binding RTX toxin-like protein
MATYTGTSGDDTLRGSSGPDTMNGGAGDDTYFVTAGDVLIDASGRDTIRTSISWDLGAGFENLVVTGHDATSSQGNDLDNRMVGNDAANYFNARGGDDTLIGGGGDDYFDMSPGQTSSPGNDSIEGGDGIDTVDFDGYAQSAVVADLRAGTVTGGGEGGAGFSIIHGIERFVGGDFDDRITGNDTWSGGTAMSTYLDGRGGDDSILGSGGAEEILGGQGDDTLNGSFGLDTLDGGAGNDTYIIQTKPWLEPVVVRDSGGVDKVVSSYEWTLAPDFENLDLTGNSGDGSSGVGNAKDNVITTQGWWMFFTVDGAGGDDTLLGGDGYDTFLFSGNHGHDVVDGGGHDDTISFLNDAASAVVINLRTGTATDAGGTVSFTDIENASGGDFDDRIVGNDGVTHTSTSGTSTWIGGHTLLGGGGDDTVLGGDAGDELWGDAGSDVTGGDDSVSGGGGDDTISGGGGNDWLGGGDGNDTLSDTGGDDTMVGGAGDDALDFGFFESTYGHDLMNGGGGIDTVSAMWSARSAITLDLGAGTMTGGGDFGAGEATLSGIERFISGQYDDHLRGKAGADLNGGGGNDTLTSVGGGTLNGDWGNDRLVGSSGVDHFLFSVNPNEFTADIVTRFRHASDEIVFDDGAYFAIGSTGALANGDARFYAAAGATSGHDADDRFVYDTTTGALYYDSDGSGSGAAEAVATLKGHPALSAGDITVI